MTPAADRDPDRFFDRQTPGAQEWWYFDALSDDGRDALVLVWYAGLPFDPKYGVGTLRHLKHPARHPAPRALDHAAIGFSWHRLRVPMGYALNGHDAAAFVHRPDPFGVAIASSRVEWDGEGYALTIRTPAVDGRPIVADLQFRPAGASAPFEHDFGGDRAPHTWILAAADCRVEGRIRVGDVEQKFRGRGYHDHNAGADEISRAIRRWEWGRFHHERETEVYYRSESRDGVIRSLWVTCRDGRPESIREGVASEEVGGRLGNIFGVRHARVLRLGGGGEHTLSQSPIDLVDDGPFYRRWTAAFDVDGGPVGVGIAELLDTRNLHKPWFNWMIPYRLKRPGFENRDRA